MIHCLADLPVLGVQGQWAEFKSGTSTSLPQLNQIIIFLVGIDSTMPKLLEKAKN